MGLFFRKIQKFQKFQKICAIFHFRLPLRLRSPQHGDSSARRRTIAAALLPNTRSPLHACHTSACPRMPSKHHHRNSARCSTLVASQLVQLRSLLQACRCLPARLQPSRCLTSARRNLPCLAASRLPSPSAHSSTLAAAARLPSPLCSPLHTYCRPSVRSCALAAVSLPHLGTPPHYCTSARRRTPKAFYLPQLCLLQHAGSRRAAAHLQLPRCCKSAIRSTLPAAPWLAAARSLPPPCRASARHCTLKAASLSQI